jgi:prevent-host-death family protein
MTMVRRSSMKTMGAGAFKTHCLAVLDEVRDRHEEVVITKRGEPVAKLVPVKKAKPETIFGFLKGHAKIVGDVMEPTMSDEEVAQWERDWNDRNR